MNKKTMRVREMRDMLGLGKTESYWLIKKGYFKTYLIMGKMRVDIMSFEEWYASQFHYKKVNGEKPGAKYSHTMSVVEMAELLDISSWDAYELAKEGYFEIQIINNRKQVMIESFEKWYATQDKYRKKECDQDV